MSTTFTNPYDDIQLVTPERKEPKTFDRPRLYYQNGKATYDIHNGARLRIFYPDGNIEWGTLAESSWVFKHFYDVDNFPLYYFRASPCYLQIPFSVGPLLRTMQASLHYVNNWDENRGYPKQVFIEEL